MEKHERTHARSFAHTHTQFHFHDQQRSAKVLRCDFKINIDTSSKAEKKKNLWHSNTYENRASFVHIKKLLCDSLIDNFTDVFFSLSLSPFLSVRGASTDY